MKLLLTSNGLSNDNIAHAFNSLIGKQPKDTRVAFIPTAANVERDNKDWLIDDLYRIKSLGYFIDILEIASMETSEIMIALEDKDVIFVGGGNSFYLSYWMNKKGLLNALPELLKTRVYAGISAGSMFAGSSLKLTHEALGAEHALQDEDYYTNLGPEKQSSIETAHLVPFIVRPHLNSEYFPRVTEELLRVRAKEIGERVYALDDESAIKIDGDTLEVISEGKWLLLNEEPAL